VTLFEISEVSEVSEVSEAPVADGPTLADVVREIDARRDQTHGGQLSLPAELMPIPAGQLFA
jgi:hypothetical protein